MKVQHTPFLGRKQKYFNRKYFVTCNSSGWINRPIGIDELNLLTFNHWEEEFLAKGKKVFDLFYEVDNGSPVHIKAKSLKAAIRKVKKLSKYLPHRFGFEYYGKYVGESIKLFSDNKNFNEQIAKENLYSQLQNKELPSKFFTLSDDINFNRLTLALRWLGFFVGVQYESEGNYWHGYVLGNKIRGYFSSENDGYTYSNTNNQFAFDPANAFNKISRCDYVCKLPENDDELKHILSLIKEAQNVYDEVTNTY